MPNTPMPQDASLPAATSAPVLVSILNWNGVGDTLACLGKLSAHGPTAFDILVIDNVLAAHGRTPFTGPRSIALAMT